MFESFGSTTTQQRLNEPPSSKTGVKVMPRLTVFHSPPNALATYHDVRVLRIDLDVLDAAGRERRPDAPQLEPLERRRVEAALARHDRGQREGRRGRYYRQSSHVGFTPGPVEAR